MWKNQRFFFFFFSTGKIGLECFSFVFLYFLYSGPVSYSESAASKCFGSWQQLEPGITTIILWCGSVLLFVKVKIELLCAFTGHMSKGVVSGCWRQVADKVHSTFSNELWLWCFWTSDFKNYSVPCILMESQRRDKPLGKLVGKVMTAGRESEGWWIIVLPNPSSKSLSL